MKKTILATVIATTSFGAIANPSTDRPREIDEALIGKALSAHAVDAVDAVDAVNKYVATQNNTDMLATVAARAETEGHTVSTNRDDGWQKQRCSYL
ncbi:hypothetical protein OW495_05085 [Vibrio sp. 14N.309.X.WAT.E.F5]|uniref:hypothetical protein n=1 Tax=Vibrio sp. 14N.309.X.WAT.E.F5 TaxID=2998321 RepID=UPI0025B10F98|nr:hypothetical protein [Vibrio sp. 14N.309.X.WAT.E.F5]MDN2666081.1 hypothetical protein [Vibrio sp. 14N.309.X.WAT.E.F5]